MVKEKHLRPRFVSDMVGTQTVGFLTHRLIFCVVVEHSAKQHFNHLGT